MSGPIRIVVADDHALFRQGVCRILEDAGDIAVVGQADNSADAVRLLDAERPDIGLLDLNMPTDGGLGVLRELSRRGVDTPCVIVSMTATPESAQRALDAGARGYCIKDRGIDELRFAIRAVRDGGTFITPGLARILQQPAAERGVLTAREREIVGLIGDGLTSKAIAKRLFISVRTVDAHRRSVLRKLQLDSSAALVAYAVREGLSAT